MLAIKLTPPQPRKRVAAGYCEPGLISFRHYAVVQADKAVASGRAQLYRVVTVNWTHATSTKRTPRYNHLNPRTGSWVDRNRVHRNQYVFNLAELVEFIRESVNFAEDVIQVRRLSAKEARRVNDTGKLGRRAQLND
jgi:hypothetical protein